MRRSPPYAETSAIPIASKRRSPPFLPSFFLVLATRNLTARRRHYLDIKVAVPKQSTCEPIRSIDLASMRFLCG